MSTESEDEFVRGVVGEREHTPDTLRDAWRQFWWVAAASLPSTELQPFDFGVFVRERVDDDEASERLRAEDLYIAFGALQHVPTAVDALEDDCIAPLSLSLSRLGFVDVGEIQQQTREHLLLGTPRRGPALASYGGRGRLVSWVRVTAIRIGRRTRPRATHGSDDQRLLVEFAGQAHDNELEYWKQLYRDEFAAAFEQAVDQLTRDERNLLRARTIEGLALERLATLFGVSRATAARRLAGARIKLAMATKEALATRLGLGPDADEMRSILRLVRSRTELSLARLL